MMLKSLSYKHCFLLKKKPFRLRFKKQLLAES